MIEEDMPLTPLFLKSLGLVYSIILVFGLVLIMEGGKREQSKGGNKK